MNKTERELVATYMENHDTEYILQNYNEIAQFLTTPELKNNFLVAVNELGKDLQQQGISNIENYRQNIDQSEEILHQMPEGYSINEFGEIIRPSKEEKKNKTTKISNNRMKVN